MQIYIMMVLNKLAVNQLPRRENVFLKKDFAHKEEIEVN